MTQIQSINLPPRIFNLKGWIKQTSAPDLKSTFDDLLDQSKFKVLNYSSHEFPLNGFTAFWLLAESHMAVHSFTESGWSYVELSSCNKEKTLKFLTLCRQFKGLFQWENEVEELNCKAPANV